MATRVFTEGNFIVIDNGVQESRIIIANFEFFIPALTTSVHLKDVAENTVNTVAFIDFQDESGTPINTEQGIIDYINSLGGVQVPPTTFTAKFTGYTIDLTADDGGMWNDWGVTLMHVEYNVVPVNNQTFLTKGTIALNRIEDLIEFLNISQSYFYFTKVTEDKIGILRGCMPVQEFKKLTITLDDGTELEYPRSLLSYQISPSEYSTQDLILEESRIKNHILTNPNGTGKFRVKASVNASTTSVMLADESAYKKETIITNNSTDILYLSYGDTSSPTSYTARLLQDDVFIANNSQQISGIWSGTNGNAQVTEII